MPAVVCLVHTAITPCVLLHRLLRPIVYIATTYMVSNFAVTKYTGVPVYAFMHWQSSETYLLCLGMVLGFSAIYLGLVAVDQAYKRDISRQLE